MAAGKSGNLFQRDMSHENYQQISHRIHNKLLVTQELFITL